MADDVNKNEKATTKRKTIAISSETKNQFEAAKKGFGDKVSDNDFIQYLLNNYADTKSTSVNKKKLSSDVPDSEKIYKNISFELPSEENKPNEKRNLYQYLLSLLMLLEKTDSNSVEYTNILKIINFIFDNVNKILEDIVKLDIPKYSNPEYVYDEVEKLPLNSCNDTPDSIRDRVNTALNCSNLSSLSRSSINLCLNLYLKLAQPVDFRYTQKYFQIHEDYYNDLCNKVATEKEALSVKEAQYTKMCTEYHLNLLNDQK